MPRLSHVQNRVDAWRKRNDVWECLQGLFLMYLIVSPASPVTRWIRGTAELPSSFRRQLAYLVFMYGASVYAVDLLLACAISRLWHKQPRPSFRTSDMLELSSESQLRI